MKRGDFQRTITRIHVSLYGADVRELRARARDQGVPWQAILRRIVHEGVVASRVME